MGAVKLFQDCNSAKLSCHAFRCMKNTHLLRSTHFHFLWFYSIASSTGRFQTSALEEDMHKNLPSSKKTRLRLLGKKTSKTDAECSCDFSIDILGVFLPVHALSLISVRELQIVHRNYFGSCSVAAWWGVTLPGHPSWTLMGISGTPALQDGTDCGDTTLWLIADTVLMNVVLRDSQTAKTGYFFPPKYL